MRAVSLSDKTVQKTIQESFVPLKVHIKPGTKVFPIRWPAMKHWDISYRLMGSEKCEGITGCSVVSPNLQQEYGNSGSAFVWEMFDSIAYNADKFDGMLHRAHDRWQKEEAVRNDTSLTEAERDDRLFDLRAQMKRDMRAEGRFRFPPRGFTADGAIELFRLTGDLPKKAK